ncbi:pre-rRNA-processing protein TSR2 [Plectosphaerella plurivora]|uniref:Pre-rRNA-processing protein TSR2 n=1 Tax=Plectosphaerella plurivora TaxID=936078 RepID=A0A9P9A812_9PEZI|nr:pre-rRNA-processing protein TSR2 [Plectosphaerella plurivora]
MAANTSLTAGSNPTNTAKASAQADFEQAVVLSLHVWPALTLSVQNSWGGETSDDKRDWFAGAVVDLFAPFERIVDGVAAPRLATDSDYEEPDAEYLEEFLLNVMMDEFDVNVDDASGFDIARQIISLRADCARGRTTALDELRTKYQSRKGKKVQAQAAATENDDEDDDSDSDSDASEGGALNWADDVNDSHDVVMDEAPQLVSASRPKPEPEVDDDGFTTVVRRR